MTCLQFRYDGYKRPSRNRQMCFFPQRLPYQKQCCYVPQDDWQQVKQTAKAAEKMMPDKEVVNSVPATDETPLVSPSEIPLGSEQTFPGDSPPKGEPKETPDFSQISQMLISKLSTTEANLSEIKKMVEKGKPFLDDFLYKLDSFMQIIEIVKANERPGFNKPQAQVDSLKTTKDSYDEFLELLQGPVFQNVLRQFLVSVMVRNEDVTKA